MLRSVYVLITELPGLLMSLQARRGISETIVMPRILRIASDAQSASVRVENGAVPDTVEQEVDITSAWTGLGVIDMAPQTATHSKRSLTVRRDQEARGVRISESPTVAMR